MHLKSPLRLMTVVKLMPPSRGSDERTDVALLKVNGTNFPELRTGDVDRLRVGEPVLAIGSPFGFDYSASAGIVSAKMRNMMGETSVPFIQTDVALKPRKLRWSAI